MRSPFQYFLAISSDEDDNQNDKASRKRIMSTTARIESEDCRKPFFFKKFLIGLRRLKAQGPSVGFVGQFWTRQTGTCQTVTRLLSIKRNTCAIFVSVREAQDLVKSVTFCIFSWKRRKTPGLGIQLDSSILSIICFACRYVSILTYK
jgi:hypothetical protein